MTPSNSVAPEARREMMLSSLHKYFREKEYTYRRVVNDGGVVVYDLHQDGSPIGVARVFCGNDAVPREVEITTFNMRSGDQSSTHRFSIETICGDSELYPKLEKSVSGPRL